MRGFLIKLGNLIMKILGLAAALICLTAPAFAQTTGCNAGRESAKRDFVEPFNAANDAIVRQDFSGALKLATLARPHAISVLQRTAVTQIEVAAYAGLDDRPAAAAHMKSALSEACLPAEVGAKYIEKLTEWGIPIN